MNPVPMQCPLCAGTIQIDPVYAGQQVACPLCQGVMVLPPPEFFGLPPGGYSEASYPPKDFLAPATPLPPPYFPGTQPAEYSQQPFQPQAAPIEPAGIAQVSCPVCTGPFQVVPQMAGQQVACPHCQNPLTIPDLWGVLAAERLPPSPPTVPLDSGPSAAAMQFIGLPQEVPPTPEVPPEQPRDFPPQEALLPPRDDRFPPKRPSPQPAEAANRESRESGDAGLYPPGMAPRSAGPRQEKSKSDHPEKVEPPRNDRFPPGFRKRDAATENRVEEPSPFASPPEPPKETATPRIDDLLPPGAGEFSPLSAPLESTSPRVLKTPPEPTPTKEVDSLLPPGAAAGGVSALAEPDAAILGQTAVDGLLPPGAADAAGALPVEQVPLPDAPPPAPKPAPMAGPGRLVLPTPEGDFVTVENKEGVKTISDKGEEIEIRKLSPEERARRRRLKNILMFTFAVILLVVVILIMTRR